MPQKKALHQKEIGKYIVSDPRVCHGEPTFKGTRKLVRDCIEMAADGLTMAELASRSGLPREAIAEALHLAAAVLRYHYKSCPTTTSRSQKPLGIRA